MKVENYFKKKMDETEVDENDPRIKKQGYIFVDPTIKKFQLCCACKIPLEKDGTFDLHCGARFCGQCINSSKICLNCNETVSIKSLDSKLQKDYLKYKIKCVLCGEEMLRFDFI